MILDCNNLYHYGDGQIQIFYLDHSFIYCYSVKKTFPSSFIYLLIHLSVSIDSRVLILFYGLSSITTVIYYILELSQI